MSLKIVYIVVYLVHSWCYSPSFEGGNDNTYVTVNRLFHIERSKNKNIVCYDLNPDATGAPDEKKPLTVYWINREKHPGRRGELSFIQEKFAYGYKVKGKQDGIISIELNATKNRTITIERFEEKYVCRIEINQQPSILQKIYVKSKTNNSLQVEYVDIEGFDLTSGAAVAERFFP